ncbi:MAG: ComEC/Rec2 family competence protein [Holosporaceae bacterium]|jgi:competence protein ComEC|nr:ComEC/Rec2 family competence protein [Holosporaceae bacterium]
MYIERIRKFFDDFCEDEKHRLLNFVPVGMGIGICLYFCLDEEPNLCWGAVLFFSSLTASIFVKTHRWAAYVPLAIALGFFASQLRTKMVDTFMFSADGNRAVSLIATVESCEKSEKGLFFLVNNAKILSKLKLDGTLNKLYLTWRGKKALQSGKDYVPGSRVLFRTILSPMDSRAFPGAYDFKKQSYFKGISARGFIMKQPKILEDRHPKASVALFLEQLRHKINKKIESYLSRDIAAVSKALITGNKTGISKEIRAFFANSGTAHILAISGLHMSIIGFFVFWIFRVFLCCFTRISMFYNTKKIAAVISWVVVLFYLNISGNSVPSVRAFIMHSLVIIAIMLNRVALTMRSIAIAATAIMLSTPEVILFPSFQMSFGAVIAIVAFYEHSWNFSGLCKILAGTVVTTIVATIPTSIFSIHTFNQLTLNSIPANVLSIPLMSFFIMPTAIVALFFMIFGYEYPFVFLMGQGVNLLIKISEYASRLPGSFFVMPTPSAEIMALWIFSVLLLTLIHHKIRFCGLVGFCAGVVLYFFQPLPDIFISRDARVVGIRTNDAVCFNHLGYCRSATNAWAKSIGFGKREKFNSEACSKHIVPLAKNSYVAQIKGLTVAIADQEEEEEKPESSLTLHLNNEENDFAELIYLPSRERISIKSQKRPWS